MCRWWTGSRSSASFVRRRRAIQLMHTFGGYQTGQALLIDRAELMRQLEALEAGAEFAI